MPDSKKIVLITEDEPPMLNILTDKLSENGFDTLQAKNGEEGLKMALEHHPDLILLDILMPKMDGLTMMKSLREDDWGKNVPVIILTNVSADTDETLQTIVKTQPAYYFVKSNSRLDDILEKVKEIITPSSPPQTP
ncbi:MAG TPA: response regulator, partial [Patescibacteria group bacterium]